MRKKLKEERIKKGYPTQDCFAKKLGISPKTYSHIERGYSFPRESLLNLIMKELDVDSLAIFENEDKKVRGEVSKFICKYMNNMSEENKNYSVETVNAIRNALVIELKDRKEKKIDIKSNSEKGKWEIYKRVASIVKNEFEIIISPKEVYLYKRCTRLEYENRTGKTTWGIPSERKRLGCNPVTGYQGKKLRLKREG